MDAGDASAVSPNEDLFVKAARIAFNPPKRKSVCTAKEQRTLEKGENGRFWSQPRDLRLTVVALCLSAVIQGFVQSVLNGSNQTLPEALGLVDKDNAWIDTKSLWIFSALNAMPYLSAGLFGCWVSDPLQWKYLGRRGAILAAACLCLASTIGAAFIRNWKQLMVCRILLGIGLGAKASITPLFCAEVSPSNLRGALLINWQLFDAFGVGDIPKYYAFLQHKLIPSPIIRYFSASAQISH